jgi:hypothetical protein
MAKVLDDARQYYGIAMWHALCWIHEIRLCKKLNPVIEYHRLLLEKFISELWDYYEKLNDYWDKPDEKVKEELALREGVVKREMTRLSTLIAQKASVNPT